VAVSSENENILLWNVASGRALPTRFDNSRFVYSVAFSPDGRTLASGADDGVVRLWNVSSGQLLKTLPGTANSSGSTTVAFSPDGHLLAAGSTTIMLWNVATGKSVYPFPHSDRILDVTSLAFSPDGDLLAFSAETTASGNAQTITLWNVTGSSKPRTLSSQDNLIYSVTFSPDGRTLAAASNPGIIQQWDVASGKKLPDIQGTSEQVLAFGPGGHILASGGGDQISNPDQDAYVELWDASSGKQLRVLS
jgi:WD40 repeat protein